MTRPKGSKNVRGRPTAGKADSQLQNTQMAMSETREEQREPKRPARVSMTQGLKLEYASKDDDYHYAWIQDRDGQVDRALQAYYEFELVEGEKVTRASGAYPLFLMKLENQYWEEDQKLKHDKTVAKIQGEQVLAADEYIPGAQDGRKHVLERDDYDPLA